MPSWRRASLARPRNPAPSSLPPSPRPSSPSTARSCKPHESGSPQPTHWPCASCRRYVDRKLSLFVVSAPPSMQSRFVFRNFVSKSGSCLDVRYMIDVLAVRRHLKSHFISQTHALTCAAFGLPVSVLNGGL